MYMRKVLFLTKAAFCRTPKLQRTNISRQKVWFLTASHPRFYSAENIDKTKDDKPVDKVEILQRFFPQAQSAQDAQEIKKEQEKFDKENKEKAEENAKSWNRMKLGFAVFGGVMTAMGGIMIFEMGAPRLDDEGTIIEDEFSHLPVMLQYIRRAWKELTFYEKPPTKLESLVIYEEDRSVLHYAAPVRMIKEPSRELLLPDPLPPPYQPTYTLVLEFTDVLVHPDWSYQTGWRFKKRPGVDQFLQSVANSDYEVIIFTTENAFMIWPVIDKLDPENKLITYRLFRDSTHFIDGVHVKNLDGLNRDLSKVIVVDWNKQATKFHSQNTLVLKKWKGDDEDTSLLDLANLLQTIAMSNVTDVREVLTYYGQFDDPIAAFRDNQRRLLEQMEKQPQPEPALTTSWLRTFTRRS